MAEASAGRHVAGEEWLGHPRGLFLLFFVETFERFSYYGMRAILIFYLTKHFLFEEGKSYLLYGAYTSLVYITPVIGGYLADRYLGPRKAVFAGGVFIALGHAMIALAEGPVGQQGWYVDGFYMGLASIIVGTGFLKANVSVLVGELYPRDDARRDPAFSIFYMGINTGGFVGPIICGYLGERVSWAWGFGSAAIGMLLGLVVLMLCRSWLKGAGEPPRPAELAAPVAGGLSAEWLIYLGGAAAILAIWQLIRFAEVVGYALLVFAAASVIYLLVHVSRTLGKVDRDRIFAALFLIALNPLFWGLFEQTGSSLNIFTDQRVDRVIFGWDVPASLFQSVNSIFIIAFAPVFAVLWTFLGKRRLEPSSPAKFGIGLILCGAGFLVLVAGAMAAGSDLTPVFFVFAVYFFHTCAELCFSPVGLSAMTRLSVSSMVGLVMGIWFLAMAAGNFIAGLIARSTASEGGGVEQVLSVYSRIGWFSVAVGVVVILLSPYVKRLMHLDTIGREDETIADSGKAASHAAS